MKQIIQIFLGRLESNFKELEIMCSNAIYVCISWYSKICYKKYCQQNASGVSRDLYIFGIFFG